MRNIVAASLNSAARNADQASRAVSLPKLGRHAATAPRLWQRALVFVAAVIASYFALAPLAFIMPGLGLDPSWEAVLTEALTRSYEFGSQIVYTGGPLSFLYTRYFSEDTFSLTIALSGFICIAVGLIISALFRERRQLVFVLLLAGVLTLFNEPRDAVFLAVPFLTAFASLPKPREPGRLFAVLMGVAASAILSLAKFAVAPLAFILFAVVDLVWISRRRIPLLLPAFAVLLFALFSLLQNARDFFSFLSGSLSIAAGYSGAMSIPGSAVETAGFILIACCLLGIVIATEVGVGFARMSSRAEAAARLVIVGGYVAMIWKIGFVRHDLHSLIAWSGLPIAALAYATEVSDLAISSKLRVGLAGIACICLFLAVPSVWAVGLSAHPFAYYATEANDIAERTREAIQFASSPSNMLGALIRRKQNAWAQVRAKLPLPQLKGSVDVIPSLQSSLLANELDYQPRYSIQEFSAYTHKLIEGNRNSLIERGPKYIFFQPGSIDDRYPALAEGPLWPDLIRYYEPYSQAGQLLLLSRRTSPLESILGVASASEGRFGQRFELPRTNEPVFLTASIKENVLGRLAELLFKPPAVLMHVELQNGSVRSYRLIPAIAAEGFLVSPLVATADDFLLVSSGMMFGPARVQSVRFEAGRFGELLYKSKIEVTYAPLSTEVLRQHPPTSPELLAAITRNQELSRLHVESGNPADIRKVAEGLLAHAPAELSFVLPSASNAVKIGFGMLDGSWQPVDGTDGVCFSVDLKSDGVPRKQLFQRCLTPKSTIADRGEQFAMLHHEFHSGDMLLLTTSCGTDCHYDWSYWSAVDVQK